MIYRKWKSALAFGVCFGAVQMASAQTAGAADDAGKIVESGQASNEYVQLRLNLKPGSEYKMTIVSQSRMTLVEPAQNGRASSKTEIAGGNTNELNYAVLWNNPDGTTQIRLTYGASKSDSTIKVNGVAVPSKTKNLDNLLAGLQLSFRITPQGKPSDVRGLDNFWKRAFGGKMTGMTPQMQAQMQSMMKKMLGDNFIKELMQQSGGQFPENPVRVGGSWMNRVQTSGQIPFDVSLKRTLQGRANGVLSIGESGTLSMGDAAKNIDMMGAKVQMQMFGTYSGTTMLDEATGFATSSAVSQRFGGSMSGNARGQKMNLKLFGLSTTKLKVEKLK